MYKWIKKFLPDRKTVKDSIPSSKLRSYFRNPALWRINSDSVSRAVAVGLFAAAIPLMPFQMLIAAFFAVLLRANLLVALTISWISNPLTLVPITYFTYAVGSWVLGNSEENFVINAWDYNVTHNYWASLTKWFLQFGKAFFIGLPIVAIGSAILGYLVVILFWRIFSFFQRKK